MFALGAFRQLTQRSFASPVPATLGQRLLSSGSKGDSNKTIDLQTVGENQSAKEFARDLSSRLAGSGPRVEGRSVPVFGGGAARAYSRLNRILSENKIREEVMRRRRHEKPTYKRQRLRRESHARRFKDAVRKKVHLVWKMKTLGI